MALEHKLGRSNGCKIPRTPHWHVDERTFGLILSLLFRFLRCRSTRVCFCLWLLEVTVVHKTAQQHLFSGALCVASSFKNVEGSCWALVFSRAGYTVGSSRVPARRGMRRQHLLMAQQVLCRPRATWTQSDKKQALLVNAKVLHLAPGNYHRHLRVLVTQPRPPAPPKNSHADLSQFCLAASHSWWAVAWPATATDFAGAEVGCSLGGCCVLMGFQLLGSSTLRCVSGGWGKGD